VTSGGTEEGAFDHLLGDELRRVVIAQRGPRPRAFQARYQRGGGAVAWSVRLVAVGFTAVALTAGGAAFAAAAGTGQADPLRWAQVVRQTVSSFEQQHGWGQGAIPSGGGANGSGQPAPTPRLGQPVPAGNVPESQTGGHRSRSTPTPQPSASPSSQPSPAVNTASSPDPSRSGGTGRTGRHRRPGG
jgi:hypothetical protein